MLRRDAGDVPITMVFGLQILEKFHVVTEEVKEQVSKSALSYEHPREHAFTDDLGMLDRSRESWSVDDDADTREPLKAILQRSGAYATVVSLGEEALETIKKSDLMS